MKNSAFLFLRLFVLAGMLTCLLPYACTLMLAAKDKATQTCQPTTDSDRLSTGLTYALR